MARLCEYCDEKPGNRKCSGCSQAWYCSKECQKGAWFHHKFANCNYAKEPTTADYLAMACVQDLIPTHQQTLIDYGFQRAFTNENQSNLFGLYVGLFNILEVPAKTVHRWRKNGVLISEIKKQFEENLPSHFTQGQYYPWFLQNQWVLDGKTREEWGWEKEAKKQGDDMLRVGWIYTGGSPTTPISEIKEAIAKWPIAKRQCHQFCSLILSGSSPPPSLGLDLWISFGYCTCRAEANELSLSEHYQQVLNACSFEEFFAAYTSSRLYDLFLAKGIREQLIDILYPHFKDFLALSPTMRKSVWDLKQFIVRDSDDEDLESPRLPCNSVMVDYGFANCKTEDDFNGLKAIYATLFEKTRAEPPELHRACIEGKVYDFVVKRVKITEKKKYKRLMKNPYPLTFPA